VDLSADYVKPLRQGRVEAGFKGRHRSIPVDMQFFAGQNSPIDTGAGGWATYRETIPAVYGTYVFESERIELEGGVRFEGVRVDYDVNPTTTRTGATGTATSSRSRTCVRPTSSTSRTSSRCSSTGAWTARTRSTSASSRSTTSPS
jgi:hypothetical protein